VVSGLQELLAATGFVPETSGILGNFMSYIAAQPWILRDWRRSANLLRISQSRLPEINRKQPSSRGRRGSQSNLTAAERRGAAHTKRGDGERRRAQRRLLIKSTANSAERRTRADLFYVTQGLVAESTY
jgi:hypothetical protein